MQSNNGFQSRLPLPKTISKPSMVRPSFGLPINRLSLIPKPSTTMKVSSTSFKTNPMIGNTGGGKMVRPRVGTLSTVAMRVRPYPLVSGHTSSSSVAQVVTRLDFGNEAIHAINKTPICDHSMKSWPQIEDSTQKSTQKSTHFKKLLDRNDDNKRHSMATSPAFDWNSITKEAELMAMKTQMSELSNKLEESNVKNSQIKVNYEMTFEKLNKEIVREREKAIHLENDLKCVKQKAEESVLQLNNAREEFSSEYEKYENKIIELQKQNNALSIELSDTRMENQSIKAKHSSECVSVEHQMQTLETQVIQMSEEREVLVKHLEELISEAKDKESICCQLNKAKLEISELNEEIKSYKEGMKLTQILQNEIQEYKQFKEENMALKRDNQLLSEVYSQNIILKEKVNDLESELNKTQNQMKDSVEMDVDSDNLRGRLSEWESVMATDSPSRVSQQINEMKRNELVLRSEISSLKAQLNEIISAKTQMESEFSSVKSELTETLKKMRDESESMKRLNRKCLLFAKEKDIYKNLIASYEHDVTLDINKSSQERIAALETTLNDYRVLLEQNECELKQLRDETKVEEYKTQINELQIEVSKLRSMNTELDSINKSPPFNSSDNFRVIHLSQNPLTQNIDQQNEDYKRLIDENRRLTTRLELLETGCDADMTRQLDEGIKNTIEVEKLKEKLNSAEKLKQKIMDVFKKTSKEFREVCYILTGYRIDLLKQNTYRLSHIYAESQNDVLLFEWDSDRTIKLLENNYSEKLKDSVQTYLSQHDSFPAFLASLTLELFRKQTHYIK